MEGDGGGGREAGIERKLMEYLEIIWNHWTVFLILSNRAWKRGLSKYEMSDYLLTMEFLPELCFCQGPSCVFADIFPMIFLSFIVWSVPGLYLVCQFGN